MWSSPGSRWIRFLRNYGPIPTNDNMYDESIQRALRRHEIEPLTLPHSFCPNCSTTSAPKSRRLRFSRAQQATARPSTAGRLGLHLLTPTSRGTQRRRSNDSRSGRGNSSWSRT